MKKVAVLVSYLDLVYHAETPKGGGLGAQLELNKPLLFYIEKLIFYAHADFFILLPSHNDGLLQIFSQNYESSVSEQYFFSFLNSALKEKKIKASRDLTGGRLPILLKAQELVWNLPKYSHKILFSHLIPPMLTNEDFCKRYKIKFIRMLSSNVKNEDFSSVCKHLKQPIKDVAEGILKVHLILDCDNTAWDELGSRLWNEAVLNEAVLNGMKKIIKNCQENHPMLATSVHLMSSRSKRQDEKFGESLLNHEREKTLANIAKEAAVKLEHKVVVDEFCYSNPEYKQPLISKAEHLYSLAKGRKINLNNSVVVLFDDSRDEWCDLRKFVELFQESFTCTLLLMRVERNVLSVKHREKFAEIKNFLQEQAIYAKYAPAPDEEEKSDNEIETLSEGTLDGLIYDDPNYDEELCTMHL